MLLIYTVSFLLHIPERIPAIAVIRPDLILLAVLSFSLIGTDWNRVTDSKPGRLLLILCAWIVLTIPFVEWPGSVIRDNWKPFLKAIIFFFAIVLSVSDRRRLKTFLIVFLGCQFFRVIEPLYMHVTDGYWGDAAHLGGGEFMNRLSGSPVDVVNPNGLAFVIVILLPFLHIQLFRSDSRLVQLLYLAVLPVLAYALMLTGSRSGLIGVFMVLIGLTWFSKKRLGMVILILLASVGFVSQLDDYQRDRYLSIFSAATLNAASAQGRIKGWSTELSVALKNPVFGHGVATSKEALFNVRGAGQVSHNLYSESVIELGLPGTIIFFWFLLSSGALVISKRRRKLSGEAKTESTRIDYLQNMLDLLTISFFSWFIFHLAQYGLTEYHWYVLCGIAVVTSNLVGDICYELTPKFVSRNNSRSAQV